MVSPVAPASPAGVLLDASASEPTTMYKGIFAPGHRWVGWFTGREEHTFLASLPLLDQYPRVPHTRSNA